MFDRISVQVYKIYTGARVTVFKEDIPRGDDVKFESGMLLYYKDYNIHKLYKVYSLQSGEFLEISRVEDSKL